MRRRHLPLLLLLGACTVWHPVTLPTPDEGAWQKSGSIRVTTTSGTHLRAGTVRFTPDSALLIQAREGRSITIPRNTIVGLDENKVSTDRSIFLVLGAVAVAVLTLVAVGNSFGSGTPIY